MSNRDNKSPALGGVIWSHISLFCFLLLVIFAAPALAQTIPGLPPMPKIPGCNSSMREVLQKIPEIPGIKNVTAVLNTASELAAMADDDIVNQVENLIPMLDKIDPNNFNNELGNLDSLVKNPSFETASALGGSINDLLGDQGLPVFDSKLRVLYSALDQKLAEAKTQREKTGSTQESDAEKKYNKSMTKIRDMMAKWPETQEKARKGQDDMLKYIKYSDVMAQVNRANTILDKVANPETLNGEDFTSLLSLIKGLDMTKLQKGKDTLDAICSKLPRPGDVDILTLLRTIDAFTDGLITKAVDWLKDKIAGWLGDLIDKLKDGKVKDAAKKTLDKLKNGDIGGALDSLKNSGVDAALDKLGGFNKLNPTSGGGPGSSGGSNGNGGLDDTLDNLGNGSVGTAIAWLTCKKPKAKEKIECPTVECDANIFKKGALSGSKEFVERVENYFTYKPPADNRSLYLNKDFHDYEINKTKERKRPPAYNMKQSKKGCNPLINLPFGKKDNTVSEPCQDNRWRDMCLMGTVPPDIDYAMTGRKLMGDEEPLPGVAGSSPIYNKSSSKLNCLVPKNTERLSPLEFDNGWRYRDMCPGSQKLRRVERDKREDILDLFRGDYGCLAPLPVCDLRDDWQRDTIRWKNAEYGTYLNVFGNDFVNKAKVLLGADSLQQKLKNLLDSDQFKEIKRLLDPKASAAAECKPAFWVRLMLDSCANQYILQKSFNPDFVYNDDRDRLGHSPRLCQPFNAVPIGFGEEEYKVSDYLKRSYKGLLQENYMPWVQYDRQEGKYAAEGEKYRDKNWPQLKIKWKNNAAREMKDGLSKIKSGVSINDYASHPVERIVDPMNPFSPRYDIAELTDGKLLTDRNLFGKSTESEAKRTWAVARVLVEGLKKYACVPKKPHKGYWEFGCTIYCSAVEVDLLRFRYKDYRLCMGCQIDANEKAFWDEYERNRKYYVNNYCWMPLKDKDCEYGDDICNKCTASVTYGALCAASCVKGCDKDLCEKAAKKLEGCIKCYAGAKAEALERTRDRTNEKAEPEWGPTAVGDNWPVCSTRFDHKGDPDLCEKAKEEYGCDQQGEKAETDPNIAKESKKDAEQCIKKDIDEICHDAAKPVYSVNFLKIRTRKGDFRTDDTKITLPTNLPVGIPVPQLGTNFKDKVEEWRKKYADEDPAPGYSFREYFGNHRPYMRWWDTGKEAFQVNAKPDYWCDWGQNDAIMGVGRDYNSIHGRKAQLCRYGGGGGIGNSCFTVKDWAEGKDVPNGRKFPDLAGSEWAELKMYQANCYRNDGLNCLCQYEKSFKDKGAEEKMLAAMGGFVDMPEKTAKTSYSDARVDRVTNEWPLSWRGYISTPANRDDSTTSPAISKNQQFPYLFGDPEKGSMIAGGLDKAEPGDIAIWPAGTGTLPHLALVDETNNLAVYGSLNNVPGRARWVRVRDANNGKYPDACGNTTLLGRGPGRTLYPSKDELPSGYRDQIKEQVTSTYYCDDPELGHCVDRDWNKVMIYRPASDVRELP